MQVEQAIISRQSCRDFSDKEVTQAEMEKLLRLTCQAPSAINLQPWQFTVVQGEEVGRLSKKLLKAHSERGAGCKPDNQRPLPQVYLDRQKELDIGMKPLLQEAGVEFANFINHGSLSFYGARNVVIATLHTIFSQGRALDIGIATGWLLLAAYEMGLATCPIGLVCAYEDVIKDFLNIEEDRQVVLALAVGHAKDNSVVNRFKTPRAPLDQVVRWY